MRSVYDAAPASNTTNPSELKAAFTKQLRTTAESLGDTAKNLNSLPSSPIGDGNQVVEALATKFTGLVDTFGRAESAMKAANADMADIGRVMAGVGPITAALTSRPLKDVAVSPEFKAAGTEAQKCRIEPWWGFVGR